MTAPGELPPIATGWWPKRSSLVIPIPAALALQLGAPIYGIILQPGRPSMALVGSIPRMGWGIRPDRKTLLLTGKVPRVAASTADINIERINQPVPEWATQWRVWLLGSGGGGGGGQNSGSGIWRRGGGGGGGGSFVNSNWQSVSLLGSTYSVDIGARGTGGESLSSPTSGTAGGHSLFSSGSVLVQATGGGGGAFGLNGAGGTGGAGGVPVISGITGAVVINGTAGGSSTNGDGQPGVNNTFGGGPGGGAGGTLGPSLQKYEGGKGGDSTAALGGITATSGNGYNGLDATPNDLFGGGGSGASCGAFDVNSYFGGPGGRNGAGGGGSNGGFGGSGRNGGTGGESYALVQFR